MNRILYLQYTNPAGYPPLEHSSRILADCGWQVLFLGTGALGANGLRFSSHPRITIRQLKFQPAGWRQKLHYVGFCLWCFGWALRWRPRWIYASDLLSCPPALLINGLLRIAVVYHEHDSPGNDALGAFTRLCLLARRACARRAKVCILPNQQRAVDFRAATAPTCKVQVVWNCPSKTEVIPDAGSKRRGGLRLLYHGSIVPERLPLSVLDAVAEVPDDVSLRIVGYETVGSIGYLDELRTRSAQLRIAHRIEIVGTVPSREELLNIGKSCDVGLALMPKNTSDRNIQTMTGASNKPFDYLACGLALLVSDLPDWCEMFVKPGFGLCCDPADPGSIAVALRRLYQNPDAMQAMGRRGQLKVIAEWNYETEFNKVLQAWAS